MKRVYKRTTTTYLSVLRVHAKDLQRRGEFVFSNLSKRKWHVTLHHFTPNPSSQQRTELHKPPHNQKDYCLLGLDFV